MTKIVIVPEADAATPDDGEAAVWVGTEDDPELAEFEREVSWRRP